jgi:thiol-disulfide isomerase/thioredoxin
MKLKLGLLFVVFSVLAVFGVFYAKDYISYDVMKPQAPQQDVKTVDILSNQGLKFVDYGDAPLSNNKILSEIPQSYAKGDLVIVHFWASWCAPCVNEVPEVIRFVKDQEKNGVKFHFIVVNLDSELEDIQKFLKSFPELNKDPFVRIWDKENALSKYFDIDKLPATVVFQNTKAYRKINGVVEWTKVQF